MLEAAIITPLILLLTLGTIEFSSVFYVYLALHNGVSQATRFGVTGSTMGSLSRTESIKAAMRQATPTLSIADGAFRFEHLPPGGSTWVGGTGGPNAVEKLTVDYTWTFFTPLMRPFFPTGQLRLRVDSIMRNEGRFQ
jgi:Flp pilus assembly protein TadG